MYESADVAATVIPGRDRSTLQQSGHYFLLFPNPAYARAFQGHVISLHRIARTHTPTSIESPIRPPPGMLMDGEDVYGILQSYALCPPSQKISLKVLFPPYSSSMKKLLNQRGYNQIVSPDDKTGRSVLVWVEGYQPTLYGIQSMIHADGRNRGLAWGLANSQKPIVKVNESNIQTSESDGAGSLRDEDELQRQRLYPRYIASFVDENEARRFIRAWHRRPFPLQGENVAIGEPLPLVHAELLW